MNRFYHFAVGVALFLVCWPLLEAQGNPRSPLEGKLALIALNAPGPWQDKESPKETPRQRFDRLTTIAYAISLETEKPPEGWRWGPEELAALDMATTYEEGWRWHLDVHSGVKTGDQGKARCLNQLHWHPEFMPKHLWLASTGTDLSSTRICIAGANRMFAYYSAACVSEWRSKDLESSFARIIAGYGTGKGCDATGKKWAWDRARLALKWLKELKK